MNQFRLGKFDSCGPSAKHGDRGERRHGEVLGFWEKARGGRATFIFSIQLSNCHTVILSNCQTIKKMELFRC